MQKTFLPVLFLLSMIALAQASPVQLNASMRGFLQQYMPNATINTSTYYNFQYANSSYLVMENSNSNYVVVNSTAGYSILTNNTQLYPILKGFMLGSYTLNTTLLDALSGNMIVFAGQAKKGFVQCLSNTGLNGTNLATNSFYGCYSNPLCYQYISNATMAPSLEHGIVNFSKAYNTYNSSYNDFNGIVPNVNSGNAYVYVNRISADINNIVSLPTTLAHNQLFYVPGTFDTNLFKNCPIFPTPEILQSSPWYCQMLHYCSSINFNYSIINSSKAQLSKIVASTPSNQTISAKASTAALLGSSYVTPVLTARNTKAFKELLNQTQPLFNSVMANALALSKHVSNASLALYVSRLNATYSEIVSKGIYQNLTAANATVYMLLNNVTGLYGVINNRYLAAYNLSVNTSAILLQKQLESPEDPTLAALTSRYESLQAEFSKPLNYSGLALIEANLTSIKSAAMGISSPLSLAAFVKATDSWFVNPLVSMGSMPLQSRIAVAPLYAALLSLVIGLVLLFIVYLVTYARFNRNKHIHKSKDVKKAWVKLFAILSVAVLIYAYVTYLYAASANQSLPLDGFLSSLKSGSQATIVLNQSLASDANIMQCVTAVKSGLLGMGKQVQLVSESNYVCNITSSTAIINPDCINQLYASGSPTIFITGGSNNYLGYKGMYGTVLYASGMPASGSSCYVAQLLK